MFEIYIALGIATFIMILYAGGKEVRRLLDPAKCTTPSERELCDKFNDVRKHPPMLVMVGILFSLMMTLVGVLIVALWPIYMYMFIRKRMKKEQTNE
jgi:hypothetical protein